MEEPKLENLICEILDFPDGKFSNKFVKQLIESLDDYINNPGRYYSAWIFEKEDYLSYELIGLLYGLEVMDKYKHLFDKELIEKYSKLNELDIYPSDMIICLNSYNIDKYYDKFYNSLLPQHQEVINGCAIDIKRSEEEGFLSKTTLLYEKDDKQLELELSHAYDFRIITLIDMEDDPNYVDYILKNKIMLTRIDLNFITAEELEIMYSYSVEQGFDVSTIELPSFGEYDVEKAGQLLKEAFAISEEFYIFAVELVKKCADTPRRKKLIEGLFEVHLLSVKKVA